MNHNTLPSVLFVADIPFWGGSTLSLRDMITTLEGYIYPLVLVPEEGDLSKWMIQRGGECLIIPYPQDSFKSPSFAFLPFWLIKTIKYEILCHKFLKQISYVLRDRRIDIIHSNTSAIDIGCELANLFHAKHVWHIREMLASFNYIHFVGLGIKRLKKRMATADRLIFISSACRDYWSINSPNANQIVVGDAVRSKSDAVFLKDKKKYYLFCSVWLSNFKGTEMAIHAFALSGLADEGYKLKLIGRYKKRYRSYLEKISVKLNVDKAIDYIGIIDSNAVMSYMAEATAFLQCSKIEGLGRTAIEAMFYGCPVIARNCGGTLDYVRNGETGFLWNTIEELAHHMRTVAYKDVNDIIKKSQKTVLEKYCKDNYGEKILSVYNQIIEDNEIKNISLSSFV